MPNSNRTVGQTITHLIIVICSCAFISFYQGGIWLLIPPLNGTMAFGISLILTFLILTSRSERNYLYSDLKIYGIAVFILLSIIYMFANKESFTSSGFLIAFYCFVMMCIGAYIHNNEKERNFILLFILAENILKELVDIYELLKNPMIMRNSAFDLININGSGLEKLVNIPSIYTFVVIYFIVLCNFRRSKYKVLSVAYMAVTLYVLYLSQMSLPLLLTIIITLFLLLVKSTDMKKVVALSVVFFLFFMILLPTILTLLLKSSFLTVEFQKRIQDIYDIFFSDASFAEIIQTYGNGAEEDYTSTEGRLSFYIQSFRAMAHNFFLGTLTPNSIKTGGHSTWIDYIAKYGCLVFVYYFSLIQYARKKFRMSDLESKKVLIAISIFYLFSGLFNSFQIVMFTMHMFIIIPYFDELLTDDTKLIIKRRPM